MPDTNSETEKVYTITASPTKAKTAKPTGELKEITIRKQTKKKPSKFPNSPLNWIDESAIDDGNVDDITIVTAYINLGRYSDKGKIKYSPELYHKWMKILGKIKNPVITFMNDKYDIALFNKIRKEVPEAKSKVELVNKSSLWGFDFLQHIAKILGKQEHSKNVNKPPDYLSVLHSKYDFVGTAMKYNHFKTKYYCWMDMDLFRDVMNKTEKSFSLAIPENFEQDKIAYSEEFPKQNKSITEIFRDNKSWISGSLFFGRASIMKSMVKQYVSYTEMFINGSYVNSDEQVLYAMYQSKKKGLVSLQVYPVSGKYKRGQQLGYLMKEAGEKKKH